MTPTIFPFGRDQSAVLISQLFFVDNGQAETGGRAMVRAGHAAGTPPALGHDPEAGRSGLRASLTDGKPSSPNAMTEQGTNVVFHDTGFGDPEQAGKTQTGEDI